MSEPTKENMMSTHANCSHPATPTARRQCRQSNTQTTYTKPTAVKRAGKRVSERNRWTDEKYTNSNGHILDQVEIPRRRYDDKIVATRRAVLAAETPWLLAEAMTEVAYSTEVRRFDHNGVTYTVEYHAHRLRQCWYVDLADQEIKNVFEGR